MDLKSLAEICNELKLSRRTIQGYEKEGLLRPSSKNNRGYLLYDEIAIKRILFIRYYQKLGFKLKEIKVFIDKSDKTVRKAIASKLPELEVSKNKLEVLINDSHKIVELLEQKENKEIIYQIIKEENLNEKVN